jgi:hypothetical protein
MYSHLSRERAHPSIEEMEGFLEDLQFMADKTEDITYIENCDMGIILAGLEQICGSDFVSSEF